MLALLCSFYIYEPSSTVCIKLRNTVTLVVLTHTKNTIVRSLFCLCASLQLRQCSYVWKNKTASDTEIRIRYGEKVVLRRKKNTYLQLFDEGRPSPFPQFSDLQSQQMFSFLSLFYHDCCCWTHDWKWEKYSWVHLKSCCQKMLSTCHNYVKCWLRELELK